MTIDLEGRLNDLEDALKAEHHHGVSRGRVYPQVVGATITLISDGVADTFGSWTEIVPIDVIDFIYQCLGLVIHGVDAASTYFIQLGYSIIGGSDPTTAQILGEMDIKIVDVPIARATEILDFHSGECPANAKLWGRLKTDGGVTDEGYVLSVRPSHTDLASESEHLATGPWST